MTWTTWLLSLSQPTFLPKVIMMSLSVVNLMMGCKVMMTAPTAVAETAHSFVDVVPKHSMHDSHRLRLLSPATPAVVVMMESSALAVRTVFFVYHYYHPKFSRCFVLSCMMNCLIHDPRPIAVSMMMPELVGLRLASYWAKRYHRSIRTVHLQI